MTNKSTKRRQQKDLVMGQGCIIGPDCSLENVTLGDAVQIGDGAQLKNVVIGSHTKIGRCARFYSSQAERPIRIGHHCVFAIGTFGEGTGGEIRFGDYVGFGHGATILTSSGPTQSPMMDALFPLHIGDVLIGDHAWIGAHTVILPSTIASEGCVVAANSVLRPGHYNAWSVYGGTPARLIRELDPAAVTEARARLELRNARP